MMDEIFEEGVGDEEMMDDDGDDDNILFIEE